LPVEAEYSFIIAAECILCEIQAEAEEIVEHEAYNAA
jgi:hypothetical protein